jgi:hypothetical protein
MVIFAFEQFSCAASRGMTLGTLVAVASTVRYNLDPEREWNAEAERAAVLAALMVPRMIDERGKPQTVEIDWGRRFRQVTDRAKRIVAKLFTAAVA